ncbi:branched-chain amino acid ABC transporter permease [Mitsuaria sp. WAJ17]|uniref:branched-chain amino acid ABC transporter permease n=1 Tax=Mitsuaria sp. WAJ17 TaxID=2761452 RepID=UPI0016026CB2|nr:branched-chain amino acid ABC transporter permease [Mitsuaria sp. WAJ17]MBB2484019.1 branched-chain amino acid ABC transporter permease [Mitsuaria sp. WAJ17]
MRHRLRALAALSNQPRTTHVEKRSLLLGGLLVLALVGAPWLLSSYATTALRDSLILAIFAVSYDLLWGKAMVLTLGHAVFFGIGAYGVAIATTQLEWSWLQGTGLGMAAAVLMAVSIGYLLLYAGVRLHFFAIITMAVLLITRQLATSWQSVTGGDVGILGIPGIRIELPGGELDFSDERASYLLALFALVLVLLLVWRLVRTRYGLVLAAIGMNEFRAKHCGFDTSWHLVLVFTLSAALAAFSGALYAGAAGVVAPDLFSILMSTEVILWVAVGGRGTLIGPVIAAVFFTRVQQEVSSFSTDLWPLILGVLFLVCVLALPNGIVGLLKSRSRAAPQQPAGQDSVASAGVEP